MPKKRDQWVRGYFCAVAMFLKMHFQPGVYDHQAEELFKGGGDWRDADPEDIETFKAHGLIPREPTNAELIERIQRLPINGLHSR